MAVYIGTEQILTNLAQRAQTLRAQRALFKEKKGGRPTTLGDKIVAARLTPKQLQELVRKLEGKS